MLPPHGVISNRLQMLQAQLGENYRPKRNASMPPISSEPYDARDTSRRLRPHHSDTMDPTGMEVDNQLVPSPTERDSDFPLFQDTEPSDSRSSHSLALKNQQQTTEYLGEQSPGLEGQKKSKRKGQK